MSRGHPQPLKKKKKKRKKKKKGRRRKEYYQVSRSSRPEDHRRRLCRCTMHACLGFDVLCQIRICIFSSQYLNTELLSPVCFHCTPKPPRRSNRNIATSLSIACSPSNLYKRQENDSFLPFVSVDSEQLGQLASSTPSLHPFLRRDCPILQEYRQSFSPCVCYLYLLPTAPLYTARRCD